MLFLLAELFGLMDSHAHYCIPENTIMRVWRSSSYSLLYRNARDVFVGIACFRYPIYRWVGKHPSQPMFRFYGYSFSCREASAGACCAACACWLASICCWMSTLLVCAVYCFSAMCMLSS